VNIGDVQIFLRSLGTLLAAHQGKKPAADFDAFCDALDPFRDQTLAAFAPFLVAAAEFQRTGIVPAKPSRPRKPATPKAALKRKDDVQAIEEAAASLQGLFDRATDPTLSHEAIEAEVARIERAFDMEGLKAVARRFGLTSGLTTKANVKSRILARIAERKARHERGEVIGEVARTRGSPTGGVNELDSNEGE
jgi:hypothetical protein